MNERIALCTQAYRFNLLEIFGIYTFNMLAGILYLVQNKFNDNSKIMYFLENFASFEVCIFALKFHKYKKSFN